MFKQFFASGDLNIFPIVGLMIFFVMMIGVYLWVMRPGRGGFYAALCAEALDLVPDESKDAKSHGQSGQNKSDQ